MCDLHRKGLYKVIEPFAIVPNCKLENPIVEAAPDHKEGSLAVVFRVAFSLNANLGDLDCSKRALTIPLTG